MKRWTRVALIIVGVLLSIVLVGPFLVPVPPLEDTVPPEQLADPDSQFVEVNGLRVHYKMMGAGEPVLVLLHGFGASLFSWHKVMEPLSEVGTVIAFDRPAFGLTERPLPGEWTGESPYSTQAQVELTIGLLDALGVERAILVGNSAGGTIAMLTALAHAERVQALVLVDPAVYTGGGSPALARLFSNTPQMQRIGPLLARRIRTWGQDLLRLAWHDPSKITPEDREGYLKPLQAENWDRALWELTRVSRAPDLVKRLAEIQMDCLVITGDDDRIVPTEQSIRLSQELPHATLTVIPNCGHVPQEECPDEFLRAVRDLLPSVIPSEARHSERSPSFRAKPVIPSGARHSERSEESRFTRAQRPFDSAQGDALTLAAATMPESKSSAKPATQTIRPQPRPKGLPYSATTSGRRSTNCHSAGAMPTSARNATRMLGRRRGNRRATGASSIQPAPATTSASCPAYCGSTVKEERVVRAWRTALTTG